MACSRIGENNEHQVLEFIIHQVTLEMVVPTVKNITILQLTCMIIATLYCDFHWPASVRFFALASVTHKVHGPFQDHTICKPMTCH